MGKKKNLKLKKLKAERVSVKTCRTKVSTYWLPLPYGEMGKFIPSTVECLFHPDYYNKVEAAGMLRSL